MSKVTDLIRDLADKTAAPNRSDRGMVISLNQRSNELLVELARVLGVPSGVLASRLLTAALADAEEIATDIDLYDRS